MRYAPVRAILSSNAPSVASVSRFWRSYSTSPTRPTASNVTATKSPATRTLRRCQSRSRGNWFADVDVTAAMIARVVGYRLVEGNSHSPQHGDRPAKSRLLRTRMCQEPRNLHFVTLHGVLDWHESTVSRLNFPSVSSRLSSHPTEVPMRRI